MRVQVSFILLNPAYRKKKPRSQVIQASGGQAWGNAPRPRGSGVESRRRVARWVIGVERSAFDFSDDGVQLGRVVGGIGDQRGEGHDGSPFEKL